MKFLSFVFGSRAFFVEKTWAIGAINLLSRLDIPYAHLERDQDGGLHFTTPSYKRKQLEGAFTAEGIPNIKTKESARYYLDMLTIVFQDLLNITINSDVFLKTHIEEFKIITSKLKHIQASLLTIMASRGQIDMNINIGLLIDHVIQYILKGDE